MRGSSATPRTRWAAAVLVVAAVGAAAGCSRADPAPSPDPTGVLDAYLDEIFGSVDAETWVADHDATQEQVAACMAELGFEYRPTQAPPQYVVPELTPAYAAEFGYGDTTEAYGPDVPPMRFSAAPGDDPAADFNNAYLYGLAPDAQEQYRLALFGRDPVPDEDPADLPPDEAGCYARANAAVFPQAALTAEFRPVQDAIREEIWWVDDDPRIAATQPAWADCMADAGYPGLAVVPDAAALVTDRTNASSLSLAVPYAELKERFPTELAELQRFEVEVAVADAACREESGWYGVRADVLAEREASILERYRAELDAMVERVRELRAPPS